MRFSRFFIDRPVFACVLSVVITLMGILAMRDAADLRIPGGGAAHDHHPRLLSRAPAPRPSPRPSPRRSSRRSTACENMLYVTSQSTADGRLTVNVTFELGTDLDQAQVLVQNRVCDGRGPPARGGAPPRRDGRPLLAHLPDGGAHAVAGRALRPDLRLQLHGDPRCAIGWPACPASATPRCSAQRDYSMRIWLDPETIAARGLTAGDVLAACAARTSRSPLARLAQSPSPAGARSN